MKIEKISDNQIRCTLNKNDLASREIKISELAYGTEKAKNLFRDMMQQAAYEFGFEADDLPLMIEAIPMSAESIVLIITKVDDPEELDTRFSKFTPSYEDMDDLGDLDTIGGAEDFSNADDVLELFSVPDGDSSSALYAGTDGSDGKQSLADTEKKQENQNVIRFYSFDNFSTIEQLARVLNNIYMGRNSLYKDSRHQIYHLVLTKSDHTPQEFNKVLNIVSEYGTKENASSEKEEFFREHYQIMIDGSALQILGDVL
ncbi:MAG: adaptor protein MecA [Lachnospiraceae bacterium]|nr:adaptor protein MecA [Lachnospiraceae bacterium]